MIPPRTARRPRLHARARRRRSHTHAATSCDLFVIYRSELYAALRSPPTTYADAAIGGYLELGFVLSLIRVRCFRSFRERAGHANATIVGSR